MGHALDSVTVAVSVEADVLDGICGVLSSSCKLMGGNHSSLERWKLNTVKGGVL